VRATVPFELSSRIALSRHVVRGYRSNKLLAKIHHNWVSPELSPGATVPFELSSRL